VRRVLTWLGATAFLLAVAVLGYAVFEYHSLDSNLQRSDILGKIHPDQPTERGLASDTNILIMGLDSRLDLQGNPLPQEMYDAMHTGDSSIGGMNSNVMMILHIPADGRQATVMQIPRDDFVEYADCYDAPAAGRRCDGKIKEAYDHAFEAKKATLAGDPAMSEQEKHRQARDAGRAAQMLTVEKFLGNGIRFDHWIEVTMVAFYQIAQQVQPITVCLKNDTKDSFSGADFKAGKQEIDAQQAIRFVRQRRDQLGDESFSDLDRERRQQAFIASLMYQLKQRGTFANPARLNGLVDVATKNVAVDKDLNILEFAGQAKQLSDGKVTFYTLPIEGYFTDQYGGYANKVDVPRIQATVKKLLDPGQSASTPQPTTTTSGAKPTVTVVNASGVQGLAGRVLTGLVGAGYGRGGDPATAVAPEAGTMVEYPAGQTEAAAQLATLLGGNVTTVESSEVSSGSLRVTLGTGYQVPAGFGTASQSPGAAASPGGPSTPVTPSTSATPLSPTTVGTGGPNEDTSFTTLTALTGGSIPCVK
jgi:LCP family protein required for cell wall assembly